MLLGHRLYIEGNFELCRAWQSHARKAVGSKLPGDGLLFCMAVIGVLWRGVNPRDFTPGLLIAADLPFLLILHSDS